MADLISRPEMLKWLEVSEFEYLSGEKCFESMMREIKNAPAVNRWIPCSERLPVDEKEVLVYVRGDFDNSIPFITTAYRNSEGDWQSDYDGEVIDSKITHWMPLPEPPESEVQEVMQDDNG